MLIRYAKRLQQTCGFYLKSKITQLLLKEFNSIKHTFSPTSIIVILYGGTSQVNLNRIARLQKRACKIILDYNVVTVVESMEDLKILTVYDRLYLRKAKFMHKVSLGECRAYISELFQEHVPNENIPTLRSLSGHSFITPRPYKEIFKQSITYSGPIIWNNLPSGLKSIDKTDTFHSNFIKWIKNFDM